MAGSRPGMVDVARAAGVSHQTVSRVLNDHPHVRPETRARVLAAIAELGYRRNSAARALVTQRSATLGIVTTGSALYGPAQTLAALEQQARAAGFFVTVATTDSQPTAEVITEILGGFLDQAVEGAAVIAPTDEVVHAARLASANLPVLLIASSTPPDLPEPTISVDQRRGAAVVVEHLADLGHRDVVHLAGPPDWLDARARSAGWHAACESRGITPRPDLVGDWSAGSGYAAGRALVEDLPTAVFAANDHMALGVLRAFAEADIRVPRDVSVVGFDDVTGSDHFYPPLTTVRQDFEALGVAAIGALIAAISGRVDTGTVRPLLLRRASTGPARRAR